MQVISKIKKVEDGNSYNQMKSSAIVDDYNSIVKPFSKVEDQSDKIPVAPTIDPEKEVEVDDTYEIVNTVDIVERDDIFA